MTGELLAREPIGEGVDPEIAPGDPRVEPAREEAAAERRVHLRTLAALAAVVVCYHTSLWTLLRGVTVDTPLAYLGLVPVIAAALGWYLARPRRGELDIHDRHLDLIVGVPMVVVALVCLVVLPARMSAMYWLWRIDLLTMPLFVAGVVALLFGVRMLWRTKVAVLFLLLAWPIPFRGMVARLLDPLSELTAAGVEASMRLLPLAVPVAGDGATFRVAHGSGFLVTIASACSGANGLLGFLLIGGAIALALQGPRSRKLLWLGAGVLLVWLLNIVRILLILAVGRLAGETASIDVLHPFVGLVTFNVAALVMLWNVRRFGLRPPAGVGRRSRAVARAVPRATAALVFVVCAALVGGVADHGLQRYDPIASSVGGSKLLPFKFGAVQVPGARAQAKTSFDHGRRFFGETSTWVRYAYRYTGEGPLRTNVPVLVDVVNTDDLQTFSDFGIEACYRFHGFSTGDLTTIELGHGLKGNLLRWEDADTGIRWVSLYWIWPVRQGAGVRYERVVLLLNLDRNLRVVVPELPASVAEQLGQEPGGEDARPPAGVEEDGPSSDEQVDAFLTGWALDVVDAAVERSEALAEPDDAE
jgi:exosortase